MKKKKFRNSGRKKWEKGRKRHREEDFLNEYWEWWHMRTKGWIK